MNRWLVLASAAVISLLAAVAAPAAAGSRPSLAQRAQAIGPLVVLLEHPPHGGDTTGQAVALAQWLQNQRPSLRPTQLLVLSDRAHFPRAAWTLQIAAGSLGTSVHPWPVDAVGASQVVLDPWPGLSCGRPCVMCCACSSGGSLEAPAPCSMHPSAKKKRVPALRLTPKAQVTEVAKTTLPLTGAASIAVGPLLHAILRRSFAAVQLCADLPELADLQIHLPSWCEAQGLPTALKWLAEEPESSSVAPKPCCSAMCAPPCAATSAPRPSVWSRCPIAVLTVRRLVRSGVAAPGCL